MSKAAALFMNINAAKGLQDVMKSNLGPKGTIKMLVGGAGGESGFGQFVLGNDMCTRTLRSYITAGRAWQRGWVLVDRLLAPDPQVDLAFLHVLFLFSISHLFKNVRDLSLFYTKGLTRVRSLVILTLTEPPLLFVPPPQTSS